TFSTPTPDWGFDQTTRINRYHNVVGTARPNSGGVEQGFIRYSDGTWKVYAAPNAVDTRFSDRNDSGTVVGSWFDGGRNHGLVFYNGSYQTVDYPNAYHTQLLSINNSGVILGSFVLSDGSAGSFLLSNGQFSNVSCTNQQGRA